MVSFTCRQPACSTAATLLPSQVYAHDTRICDGVSLAFPLLWSIHW